MVLIAEYSNEYSYEYSDSDESVYKDASDDNDDDSSDGDYRPTSSNYLAIENAKPQRTSTAMVPYGTTTTSSAIVPSQSTKHHRSKSANRVTSSRPKKIETVT